MKTDYHVHTTLSPDGSSTLTEYCEAAAAVGCTELCITNHMDLGYHDKAFEGIVSTEGLRESILQWQTAQKAHPTLTLRLGMEVGYKPETHHESALLLSGAPFDFIINSVHDVDDMDPYEDTYYAGRSRRDAYEPYMQAVYDSLDAAYDYSVIGHYGYVMRNAPYLCPIIEPAEFRDLIDATLMRLIYLGKGLEVNTSTFKTLASPMPGKGILRRYRELGGEIITIGSDAHNASRLCSGFSDACALLQSLGYSYLTRFHEMKPEFYPIPSL